MTVIIERIIAFADSVRVDYGVNPWIFVGIMAGCGPVFYYALYRLIRAAAQRAPELSRWAAIFMGAAILPYLYVMIFGRNLPWWVYALVALLLGQAAFSLIRKLRAGQRPPEEKP